MYSILFKQTLTRSSRTSELLLRATSRHFCALSTVSLNHSINGYIRNGNLKVARQLFDENRHSTNIVTWNSIINGYIRIQQIQEAKTLFDQMPQRDVVSWNTMLSGFRTAHNPEEAYKHFLSMIRVGLRPDELTLAVIVSAFLNTEFIILVPQLHCRVVCLGLNLNCLLGSALMRGYVDLADRKGFGKVFDEISAKTVATWNVLLLGYMEFGLLNEAQRTFDMIPEKNAVSWSTLINGFVKNMRVDEARAIFNKQNDRDIVSWTAMIKGYVQCEKYLEALDLFVEMMSSRTRPNHYTFSSVLDACAGCSSLLTGNQIHACILKFGTPLDVILATSIIDMYAKSGDIGAAFCMFESIAKKNVVSWNSIIGGCARHGLTKRALEQFDRMVTSGVRPDQVTFINVLSACVHGGMVKEGEKVFESMVVNFGVQAEMEHYACMVDLYGRAGQLEKARTFISEMPFEPDVVLWGTLLGACGLHSCLDLGETAASGIYKLQKQHPAAYAVLSKIHGENGTWCSVIELRKMMKRECARKQKAWSWIGPFFQV